MRRIYLKQLRRHLVKGAVALFHAHDAACCRPQLLFGGSRILYPLGVVLRGTESLLTHRWREPDSNLSSLSGSVPLRAGGALRGNHMALEGSFSVAGPIVRRRWSWRCGRGRRSARSR